jgi:non-specific serine/threonine protein kinase
MSAPHSPTTIGHYVVERELGRGAMGVVFLASDTKLGRKVAIKALPGELALDPMRQMKFDREARTLAAVNHPNIGAIFGIEEAQGARYLVLELVDGETLAERLAYAPVVEELGVSALDLAEALDVCAQVAAGMAAAHEQGIIHRDLKPANVKIRSDGLVKVLDFGIARGGPVEQSLSPTRATEALTIAGTADATATHIGTIIGTPGYMSPEQARGRPVGKATDLWSFGCMIFECLSGRIAFPGETLADALAATLTLEPDYTLLPKRTPARVVELLKRCLHKDHHKRLADFAEARAELERSLADLSSPPSPAALDVAVTEPAPADELEGWPSPTGNLPGDDTSFVNRVSELTELARQLVRSRHVSVVGPVGIGKTRLAVSAARGAETAFACGAWYVEAAPVSDPSFVPLRLAATIGARAEAGESPLHAAARFIGRRRVLLVIDAAQHAPADVAALAACLLESCPRLTLVTVGREPLGTPDESVFRLAPMSVSPEPGSRDAGAPALLRERARVAKATLDATAESAAAMAALCARLQGIPLPIELVAAWAESPTFEDVTASLDDHLAAQNIAALDAQTPEQIVRIVVDWAYQRLTEGERGMLRRLSVFAGGCTLRAAAAVSGAADSFPDPQSADPIGGPVTQQESRVLDTLGRLATLSLVSVRRSADASAASTRFFLQEPVRLLARERLMQFTGSVAVLKRHAQYFAALGEQAAPRLDGPDAAIWRARLVAELPNLLAALDAAATGGETEQADRIGGCLQRLRASWGYLLG